MYSADLLGSTVSVGGTQYTLHPPDHPNIVRGFEQTVAFPDAIGKKTLNLLAVSVNAAAGQLDHMLVLNFTDGTSSTVFQSFSDWLTPKNYAGESMSAALACFNTSTGGKVTKNNFVYSCTFQIPIGKTLASLTLPINNNLVVLAAEMR